MRRYALSIALVLCATGARAESGRSGASTLTRTYSAIPGSLGGANAGMPSTLDATFFNPAAAASLKSPEIQATYFRGLEDDAVGGIRYGHAFGFGGIFAGADYFDAGEIDVNLSNGTQETRRAQQDTVGVIGFALGRSRPFSLGATAKIFRLELAEEASASGAAFDVGAQWTPPVEGLTFGVSGTNIWSDVKYEEESDPLPTAGRVGVAYNLEMGRFRKFRDVPYALTVLVDGVGQRYEDAGIRAGLELRRYINEDFDKAGSIALRAGFQDEPRTITAGLGFRLGGFGLDYAFGFVNDLDNIHRATVSWRFFRDSEEFSPKNGRPSVP